jgi:hypothetical protein
MGHTTLDELLGLAAEITALDALQVSLGKGSEREAAKKRYEETVEKFNSKRKDYADTILVKGDDWSTIPDAVSKDLDNLGAGADVSWQPAIQYTKSKLIPFLQKEAQKSPLNRNISKWSPAVLVVTVALVYFGIRFTSGVELSAILESKIGLQQRAAAAEKVIQYDDYMGARVRRGGWMKGILFWPIEPSDIEVKAAGEFVAVALEGYDVLTKKNEICGNLIGGYGDKLSDEQIKFVDEIAKKVQEPNLSWQEPPVMTILQPIKEKFPCK